MKILIVSDIHGNLPALEYCLKIEKNIDLLISLGDVVNYGPWSNECVDLLETIDNTIKISGNHERNFLLGKSESSSIIENLFFKTTYPYFNRFGHIKNYVKKQQFNNFELIHTLEDKYIFNDTKISLNKNVILGHSHQMFIRNINNFYLINPGSLGLNRKNFNVLNYILWYKDLNKFETNCRNISPKKYLSKIKEMDYPKICVEYIKSKI